MKRLVELKTGDELDEFLVEKYLSQGMSKTAKTYISKSNDVIKLFVLDKSSPLYGLRYEKFKNEAVILKNLEASEHILEAKTDFRDVAVHNSETKEAAYYVMEIMDGDVQNLILKEDISLSEKLSIVNQIILAMIDFHTAEICHRDLYTPNILYKRENGQITCKVADFGSAKQLGIPQVSPYFFPTGNLQFTSPEAVSGLLGGDKVSMEILAASDNFSLGLMIYEILTEQNQDFMTATLASIANLAVGLGMYNPAATESQRQDFLAKQVIPILGTAKINDILPSVIMSTTEVAIELNEIMINLLKYDYSQRLSDLRALSVQILDIKRRVEVSS